MNFTPSAYVLPPVNADAINTTTERFGITDAMLVSSTVPETPPATYNGATVYALGDEVAVGTAGQAISVYRSLQAANTGHTPASSPTWWELVGTTYSVWDGVTAWATGDRVIRTETHSVYERNATTPGADVNTPESTLGSALWLRISTTNRWAMFDMLSATGTTSDAPMTVVLAPGRISALALLGIVDGVEVDLSMTSGATTVYWPITETLDNADIGSWDDYLFADFELQANVTKLDIPTYSDGHLSFTITGSANVTLGKCVVGTAVPVGRTEDSPRVRNKSFSLVVRDDFGDVTDITKRKSIPLVSQTVYVEKGALRAAKVAFEAARTCPCVFIGLSNDEDAFSELLTFLGICTDSEVIPKNNGLSPISAEIEGI